MSIVSIDYSYPVQAAEQTGELLATNYRFTTPFLGSFGEALWGKVMQISDRIDFLYNCAPNWHCRRKDLFDRCAQIGMTDNILWIRDIANRHGNANLMLIREDSMDPVIYAVRPFLIPDQPAFAYLKAHWDFDLGYPSFQRIAGHYGRLEEGYQFWEFKRTEDSIEIVNLCEGFLDLRYTKSIALFVVWVSNILGFFE